MGCLIYRQLTKRGIADGKLRSITYEHVQELATGGGGGSGAYTRTIKTSEGSTSSRTTSTKVQAKIEASAKLSMPSSGGPPMSTPSGGHSAPPAGFGGVPKKTPSSLQYDFSKVTTKSNS